MLPRRSYIGETVRIRETNELAVVVSDNLYLESESTKWRAVVRTLDGREDIYFLSQLETDLSDMETFTFRMAARVKFPDLFRG